MRKLILGALLVALTTGAALAFGGQGRDFGRLGAGWAGKKGSAPAGCSNSFNFSQACNSQYIVMGPMR